MFDLFKEKGNILESMKNSNWKYTLVGGLLLALMMLVLHLMGRPWIYRGGYFKLWQPTVFSSEVSQHFTDWYSLTHIVHGLLIYWLLSWLVPDWAAGKRICLAILLEGGWEIVENTDYVIEYYRNNTMALEYLGDTIVNSLGDVLAMILGYFAARNLSTVTAIILLVALEAAVLTATRDSFFLNVIMFIYPFKFIKSWQLAPL